MSERATCRLHFSVGGERRRRHAFRGKYKRIVDDDAARLPERLQFILRNVMMMVIIMVMAVCGRMV